MVAVLQKWLTLIAGAMLEKVVLLIAEGSELTSLETLPTVMRVDKNY